MNKYEIMFIVKATLEESIVKGIFKDYEALLKSLKVSVDNAKDLGVRKLAYEIKDNVRGYYFLFNITASSSSIKEINRKFKLDENILRFMIIKEEE